MFEYVILEGGKPIVVVRSYVKNKIADKPAFFNDVLMNNYLSMSGQDVVLDTAGYNAELAAIVAQETSDNTKRADTDLKRSELAALGPGDLTTLPQIRDALLKALQVLGLQ